MIDERHLMTIFSGALDREAGAKRAAYLDEACGNDPQLRTRIDALLRAHEHAAQFLEPQSASRFDATTNGQAGTQLAGRYKLLELIGEGGMGTVWMAEQTEPVRRKVALKLLKPGMDTAQVIARFEAERQALAMMDHPHIARIFDGGCTQGEPGNISAGRPYFVMELVNGVPITEFCDQNHLTPRERLELFIPVCQAVQHAHQKGIVHRDLKPSNVLVSRHDSTAVVKVIDFGIAKALGETLTDKTLFTGITQMIGTPQYMSPEQAGISDMDVDTRSDIYSLGVLLYELLTGTTPFTKDRFKKATYDEIRRIIREEEPPKPSTRLSESNGSLPSILMQREIESAKLTKLLRGELDWIVMKALDKDRNRRYETANDFVDDIERYLNDQPVEACPPSWWYRCRKFARRHKAPVLATSLALLTLMAGIIGTTWGFLRADHNRWKAEQSLAAETDARQAERQARDQAMAALQLMTDEIVQNQMARVAHLSDEDKEFLRKIIEQFEGFAAIRFDDAESRALRAEGYAQVGAIRHRLGELKEAEAAVAESVLILKQLAAEFPTRREFRQALGRSQSHRGLLLAAISSSTAAEACFADALAIYKQLTSDAPTDPEARLELARSFTYMGNLLGDVGRLAEAEAAYTNASNVYKKLAIDLPTPGVRLELARTYNNLGVVFHDTGRLTEAELSYAEALAIQKQLVIDYPTRPELRQELAGAHSNLARLLRATDRSQEAEAAYADALAIRKQLAADFPSVPEYRNDLALGHGNLGRMYSTTGRLEEAEAEYVRALAIHKQLAADFPMQTKFRVQLARSYSQLGDLLHSADRLNEAEAAFADALAISKELAAEFPDQPDFRRQLAASHNNVGVVFRVTGRLKEARAAYADAVTIHKQLADDYPTQPDLQNGLAGTLGNLAMVCNECGDFAAAKGYLEEAQPHYQAALEANPHYRQVYFNNLLVLAGTNACLNDHAGALRAAENIRDLGWDPPTDTYNAACTLAHCIPNVQNREPLDTAERQAATQFYADHAMAMLHDAVAKSWKDAAHMRNDTDLDALRQREDFQQLLTELERD